MPVKVYKTGDNEKECTLFGARNEIMGLVNRAQAGVGRVRGTCHGCG